MRLLPRSAKGTWLLAAAVWMGGCAGMWWLIPLRPRAVMTVPGDNSVLGVSPGGKAVTLMGRGAEEGDRVPVRVWDTVAGSLRTVVSEKDVQATCAQSPDGRWLAVGVGPVDREGGVNRLRILDLTTGSEDELAGPDGAPRWYELAVFSPDSRWLAVAEHERAAAPGTNQPGVRLWDLEAHRAGVSLPTARPTFTFSPDGRRLAGEVWLEDATNNGGFETVLWDTATGRELAHLPTPRFLNVVALAPDGTALIGEYREIEPVLPAPMEYACWNFVGGQKRWSVPNGERLFAVVGGSRLMGHRHDATAGTKDVVVLDAADGREVGRMTLGKKVCLTNAGPDGQTIFVVTPHPLGLDAVWVWLAAHGVLWPQSMSDCHLELLDTVTGRRLLTLPDGNAAFAPDGQSFAFISDERPGTVELWDTPPRKPLTWFALAAAILTLLLAGLTWRRSRRLRREVA
jgi:WD40 repeat protein